MRGNELLKLYGPTGNWACSEASEGAAGAFLAGEKIGEVGMGEGGDATLM